MRRESLVTNTEKLLFDILETKKEMLEVLKRIEGNTNPLPFKLPVENSEAIGSVRKEKDGKVNESTKKVNENNKKVNVKKGAKNK
jgi:hypothetical protein